MAIDEDRLRSAVDAVYAVPPGDFVAQRAMLVKAARSDRDRDSATAIAGLRKPTAAADAVNRVVRSAHPVVAELREVGSRLRQAQSALDAVGLAGLRGRRDAVIDAFVTAAEEVGGRHTPAVIAEVRNTVIAALADVEAQRAACSGALTRALTYSGFGEVDLADAVARTSTGVLLTRIRGGGSDDLPATEKPSPGPAPVPDAVREDGPARKAASTADSALESEPDPALVELARAAVSAAERELARCTQEIAQATRLLTQAERRGAAARTAYDQAIADLAELTDEPGDPVEPT